jgi:hypothetical protein
LLLAFLGGTAWLIAHLGQPVETGTETLGAEFAPEMDPELLGFWDENSKPTQVRVRLYGLQRSFSALPFSEPDGLGADLRRLRQRAESLRRQLDAGSESEPDPVTIQTELIRRRLDLLKQEFDRRRQ